MLLKPASKITKEEIEALIASGIAENRQIEFKADLPKFNDEGKKEFLADVSAFANSGGGHILYGISELKVDGSNTGTPLYTGLKEFNRDVEVPKLEQIIKFGLQPTISGIQIESITGFTGGPVLAISIPASWNRPHLISYQNNSKFYERTSSGKSQMDVAQIKRAFLDSDAITSKIQKFRNDRIEIIKEQRGPMPVGHDGILVIHWIPIESFLTGTRFESSLLREVGFNLSIGESSATRTRFNLDGYLKYGVEVGNRAGQTDAYIQLFNSGAIEAADCYSLNSSVVGNKSVISPFIEREIGKFASRLERAASKLSVSGPYFFGVSLLNVKSYKVHVNGLRTGRQREPIDRDHLILPEQLLEKLDGDSMKLVRPTLESLWNALGEESCMHFNSQGDWTGH